MSAPSIIAHLDPQPILDRIHRGESLRTIAADLGVSNVGLRAWLLREDAEQYQHVITAALALRVAEADEELDSASDNISIARAREQCRFSRMDLERRRPLLYGQKAQQAINIAGSGEIQVQIVSYASNNAVQQSALEADVTPDSTQDADC